MDNERSKKPIWNPIREIGRFNSVEEFTKHGFSQIVEGTKAVNSFPTGATRDLYCAYPSFGKIVEQQSSRILGIISNVLKQQTVKGNIQRRQQDEQVELLQECNDIMLERINSNLDELAGIKKNPETILVETQFKSTNGSANKSAESWNNTAKRTEFTYSMHSARLLTAKNVPRPQVNFKVPLDNSSLTPFVPKIKVKPNSLKPLAVLPEYDDDGMIVSYLHPYEIELEKFEPTNELLVPVEPKQPAKMETTPLIHIASEQKLKDLLYDLQRVKEFAVDLEHHSYRTFQGITCLMQISTRHKDYIIDTLALREELHLLNEVFTNPKILKIFHGALSDIEWLQRDLSLYVVNMFDSSEAAKLLGFPRLSLAYLLKNYCNIEADKTFQLADWRIRPLPTELIHYARQDTHYLIYIYEMLRNELLKRANGETNMLTTVHKLSNEICKRRYQKPKLLPESHLDIYRKSKRPFDNRQLFALKEIFAWRDKIARSEDESYGYVLPNHMMLQIADSLPREMQGILACCNPIPPLVRQHLHFLHQIILKAREQPLVKPIIDEIIVNRAVTVTTKDITGKLHCPHDLSHNPEFRDDLPTLLDSNKRESGISAAGITSKPIISVFETPPNSEDEGIKKKLYSLKKINFVSPYDRYKAAIPLAEKERIEALKKQAAINSTKLLCPVTPDKVKQEKGEPNPCKMTTEIKEIKRKYDSNDEVDNNRVIKKAKNVKVEPARSNQAAVETTMAEREVTASQSELELLPEGTPTKAKPKSKSRKQKNRKQKLLGNRTGQSSNQSVDFSNVDYNKFKGGSQKPASGEDSHSKFAGKKGNNKVNNKKFNKLFTFSTNTNKKN